MNLFLTVFKLNSASIASWGLPYIGPSTLRDLSKRMSQPLLPQGEEDWVTPSSSTPATSCVVEAVPSTQDRHMPK
jgi:hypothetical protein